MEQNQNQSGDTQIATASQYEMLYEHTFVKGNVKKATAEFSQGKTELWKVDPADIRIFPNYNARERTESYLQYIHDMAVDMVINGYDPDSILSGIAVVEDGKHVVYMRRGHTRRESALLARTMGADIKTVPIAITQRNLDRKALIADLDKSNRVRQLTAYELGTVVLSLARSCETVSEITSALGRPKSDNAYVSGLLNLMQGPSSIVEHVRHERISAQVAINLLKEFGDKAAEKVEETIARAQRVKGQPGAKATAKFVPGAILAKAIKKSAPAMSSTIIKIKDDPGFLGLRPEVQTAIQDLIDHLNEAKQKEAELDDQKQIDLNNAEPQPNAQQDADGDGVA